MTKEEKIYKYLQKVRVDKLPLENEIFAIRDSRKKINDYTIYVDGYISLDAINKNIEKINLIQNLQEEKEKYKYLYQKALDNTIQSDRENIRKDNIIDKISQNPFNELQVNGIRFCGTDIKQYFEKKVSDGE